MPNPYGGRGLPRYQKQNASQSNPGHNYYEQGSEQQVTGDVPVTAATIA